MKKLTTGEWGWVGLVPYIMMVDGLAWRRKDETMSAAFGRWISSPRGRAACGVGWAVLTTHLWYNMIHRSKRADNEAEAEN